MKNITDDKFLNTIDEYLSKADWRIKENSNAGYSYPNMLFQCAGHVLAEYGLENLYKGTDAGEMHRKGQIHIHDLAGSVTGYCSGWSLPRLFHLGFIGSGTTISSKPAQHFRSAINHILNFFGVMSNEWMGAQAFSDVDIYLSAYILKDYIERVERYSESVTFEEAKTLAMKETVLDVKQSLQEMLFSLNFPSRWGGQCIFSNFTLALTVPNDLKHQLAIAGGEFSYIKYNKAIHPVVGKSMNSTYYTYGDLGTFINMFNEQFLKMYLKGDASERVFTFPILTVNLTPSFFNLDDTVLNLILDVNAKYGATYFQNCVNGESSLKKISPEDTRSFCCRLQLDLNELQKHSGGLFGNGEFTGSIGVVTINLPEIGYHCKYHSKNDLFSMLDSWMEVASQALEKKREFVSKNLKRGLFPYTSTYLPEREDPFSTYFLTIGYVGLHDCLVNFGIEDGLMSKDGHKLGQEILDHMRETIVGFQKRSGFLYNFEAVPAEGSSRRMATKSVERLPDLYHSGTDTPYFTNSCHPPVEEQGDFLGLIKHQNDLQNRHSGGTVVHFYIGEKIGREEVKLILKKIAESKIPYATISVVFSHCPVHGYMAGEVEFCPYEHTEEQLKKYGENIN